MIVTCARSSLRLALLIVRRRRSSRSRSSRSSRCSARPPTCCRSCRSRSACSAAASPAPSAASPLGPARSTRCCCRPSASSSLVLLAVGYLAGRWRESFDIDSSLRPPLADRRADAARGGDVRGDPADARRRGAGQPAGASARSSSRPCSAVLLAIPVYPLVRGILRPALVEDTRPTARASLDRRSPLRTAS